MIFLLDTCVLRKLLDHFPKQGIYFVKVWDKLEVLIGQNILSVDECYNELKKHFAPEGQNMQWIEKHKNMFLNPTNAESLIIRIIFQNSKMQESIHLKNILSNRPSADAYLVAKAKAIGATVVTVESFKPNSAQIPNMCELCGVPYISFDEFMAQISNMIE